MPQVDGPTQTFYNTSFFNNFGWFRPISNGENLIRLDWNQIGWDTLDNPDFVSRETKVQLEAYFQGQLKFFDLPVDPLGTTRNIKDWLNLLKKIPFGSLITYKEFANFAGKPKGARVAGMCCSKNPIPIILPCHRVIKSCGNFGNYGGGSSFSPTHPENKLRKIQLIKLEKYK